MLYQLSYAREGRIVAVSRDSTRSDEGSAQGSGPSSPGFTFRARERPAGAGLSGTSLLSGLEGDARALGDLLTDLVPPTGIGKRLRVDPHERVEPEAQAEQPEAEGASDATRVPEETDSDDVLPKNMPTVGHLIRSYKSLERRFHEVAQENAVLRRENEELREVADSADPILWQRAFADQRVAFRADLNACWRWTNALGQSKEQHDQDRGAA